MFDHAKGTQIIWKEDKDLTKEIEIKKQRNRSTRTFLFIIAYVAVTDLRSNLSLPPTLASFVVPSLWIT